MKSSSKALVIYKKKLLLILRDNIPGLKDANKWSLPGGSLESGENHREALTRELKEEIGIAPKNFAYLGNISVLFLIKHVFFIARLSSTEFKRVKLGDEGQKLGWFRVKDLKNLNLTSGLSNYFKLHGEYLEKIVDKRTDIPPQLLGLKK